MNIGRPPIREALNLLETGGFVRLFSRSCNHIIKEFYIYSYKSRKILIKVIY